MFLGSVGIIGAMYPADNFPWWGALVCPIVLLGSLFVSAFLFNKPGYPPTMPGETYEEYLARLVEEGLLVSESFTATRAFQVEEYDDEGSHYFIELTDGAVLYLNGQYLYEYEEITDDPEYNQPRRFPCSQFIVRRDKTTRDVLDIICAGGVLHPECLAPPFDKDVDPPFDERGWKSGLICGDLYIIRDRSYEQLKREYMRGKA